MVRFMSAGMIGRCARTMLLVTLLAGCAPHTATPGDAAYRSPEQGDAANKIPKGNGSPEEAHFGYKY